MPRRTSLLIITLVAISLFAAGKLSGWIVARRQLIDQRHQLCKHIEQFGGHYYLDFQITGDDRVLDADSPEAQPAWIVRLTGCDPFWAHDIVYVTFAQFDAFVSDGGVPAKRDEVTDQVIAPVLELDSLRWLALSGTAVTDETCSRIAALPRLERLWLSQTRVTDRGLEVLASTVPLTHLAIEATHTTDVGLHQVAAMRSLRSLSLGSPHYTARGLRLLTQLEALEELYLDRLPVDDDVAAGLSGLNKLRILSVRGTLVSDKGLQQLGSLRNLEELRLDGTPISDAGLQVADAWEGLRKLGISATSISDTGLQHLADCRQLESIELRQTRVTLAGIESLLVGSQGRSWPEALQVALGAELDTDGDVVALDLSGLAVRDDDLQLLTGLARLQWLKMPGARLTDQGLQLLDEANFPRLRLLDLSNCPLETPQVARLVAALPQLQDLHVRNSGISDEFVARMRDESPSLRIYLSP